MLNNSYLILDGDWATMPVLMQENRWEPELVVAKAFMRASGTTVFLANETESFLCDQFSLLNIETPTYLNVNYLQDESRRLINKSRSFKSSAVEITFFEHTDGSLHHFFRIHYIDNHEFNLIRKGASVDVFTLNYKTTSALHAHPWANKLLFGMMRNSCIANNLTETLALNKAGRLACGIESLIYVVRGNNVYTTSFAEGALLNPFRKIINSSVKKLDYQLSTQLLLTPNDILLSDELFTVHPLSGINWIVAYKSRRYYQKLSTLLVQELNQNLILG
jgi:branched-chain amino acid aminotransferase